MHDDLPTDVATSDLRDRLAHLEKLTEELSRSKETLRAILESEPECVKTVSEDGRLLDMNPAGLAMIEADSLQQVQGESLLSILAPEYAERFVELNRRVFSGESVIEKFEIVGLKGARRWMETHAVPLRDPDGHVIAHLAITRDISAHVRSEEERRHMERQILHSQKLESLGVLAGGVAHDFNNLLTSILSNAELALETVPDGHRGRENMLGCIAGAEQAAALCNQMLTYSGQAVSQTGVIDLSKLVRDTVQLLEVSASRKVTIELDLQDSLASIEVDPTQLRQIVFNLVTNAAEAYGDRPGTVTVGTADVRNPTVDRDEVVLGEPLKKDHDYVSLVVRDAGCGMDEETQARIFDPFFSTKFTGRGLGLSTALGIARTHRATVILRSELGAGTTFRLLLPTVPVRIASRPESSPAKVTGWKSSANVLVVDDEEPVRVVVRKILQRAGMTSLEARDGYEALEIYRSRMDEIDLVILDQTMPRLDGLEALALMQEIDPKVRVIMSSGYPRSDIADQSTGFIRKPYRVDELLQEVSRALEGVGPRGRGGS